jgi:hypothetical protein
VLVGTLGKALGSYGAYVCADAEIVRYLINTSRSLIFSTAPSPPAVAGALAALELLQERPHRVERLHSNARVLRGALAAEGFTVPEGDMHIVPLIVGEERAAMQLCQEAIEAGVFAQAIRPPTVPAGTSRLRLAAMASHTAADMRMAARVIGDAARKLGLDPATIGEPLRERVALDGDDVEVADEEYAYETAEVSLAAMETSSSAGVPFDIERSGDPAGAPQTPAAPRPRRPPAPAHVGAEASSAPFDGERESAIAHAA